jgi:hypothetical protein
MPPKKKIEASESEETDIESYDETDASETEHNDSDEDELDEDIDEDENEDDKESDEDNESKDKKNKDEPDEYNDDCVHRFAKPTISDESDMDVSDGNISDDDDINNMKSEFVLPEDRITKPFLSDTEKNRVILERRTHLTLGAKQMVKGLLNIASLKNPRDIALLELKNRVLPLKIIRTLPSGKKELWYLNELKY